MTRTLIARGKEVYLVAVHPTYGTLKYRWVRTRQAFSGEGYHYAPKAGELEVPADHPAHTAPLPKGV